MRIASPLRCWAAALCALPLIAVSASAAQAPAWWTAPPTQIWDGVSTDHFAPLNIGQLKHVATQAKAYLEAQLGPIDWSAAYAPNPNPFPFSPSGDNFAPANVGQLKAVSVGFYRVLAEQGYPVRQSLLFQGAAPADISVYNGFDVPWNAFTFGNRAPANLGQLKLVFSFAVSPDGSSAFDLSGITDAIWTGTDDQEKDLWSADLGYLMGLNGFTDLPAILGHAVDPGFSAALDAHLSAHPGTTGPVLLVPGQGFFRVHQPNLSLNRL